MKSFIEKPYWSFVGVVLTISFFLFPYSPEGSALSPYEDWLVESFKWSLISGAFIFALYAYFRPKKSDASKILIHMAKMHMDDTGSIYGLDKHFSSGGIPLGETWQDWIPYLIAGTKKTDLEPHNFGEHYFLYDIFSEKRIEFPREKSDRMTKISDTLSTGKAFRIVPKDI